jgi:hypothetical protein
MSFFSCKKTYIREFVYCKSNCKEINGRVLYHSTQLPVVGITILVNLESVSSGGFLSTSKVENLGYFKTDNQGVFKAKVNTVYFDKNYLQVLKYNYNNSDPIKLGKLYQYPDTITTFYIY